MGTLFLEFELSYRVICLGLFFIAHRYDGQHEVDEVKGAEKDDNCKKYHIHRATRCNHLKIII